MLAGKESDLFVDLAIRASTTESGRHLYAIAKNQKPQNEEDLLCQDQSEATEKHRLCT